MSHRSDEDYDRQGSYSSRNAYKKERSRSQSRSRSRSRSRSPIRDSRRVENRKQKTNIEKDRQQCDDDSYKSKSKEIRPPPPPRISTISVSMGRPGSVAKVMPVQMKLTSKPTDSAKKISVAAAFSNDSDDDETEQMPPECRMRMRNIGRDTPTSSGPNSFGKTKQGFCDSKKIFEKNLNNYID